MWLLLALSCGPAAVTPAEPPPVHREAQPVVPTADPTLLLWGGDTALGIAASPHLEREGYDWAFAGIQALLDDADVRILNAESPLTVRTEVHNPDATYSYQLSPSAATAMRRAGFTWASLANNHSLDRGIGGLMDTRKHLSDAGIGSFGAGRTRSEALVPALIETRHGTVGVVGLAEKYGRTVATSQLPGVVPVGARSAAEGGRRAREAGATHLVAFVHWGDNYVGVLEEQREMARILVDAGFDLVVGHGPHVVQPMERIGGVPVVYSLGNLVFGTEGRFTDDHPGYGILLRTALGDSGFQSLEAHCIRTDNQVVGYRPRPCTDAEAARVLAEALPGADIEGNRARLAL